MQDDISRVINSYRQDMLTDLARMVSIPSVRGEAQKDAPFGEMPHRALHTYLALAQRMGFAVKLFDGYAGHIAYGEGEEYVGVAVHVDVVPPGENWRTEPFALTKNEHILYGRGVSDDKGPAICALYALNALKDLGITGDRQLRIIVGCGEETGMEDLAYYFSKEPYPALGFSPDGEYPMVNRESGIIQAKVAFDATDSLVRSFSGGEVYNAVPARAECVVEGEADEQAVSRALNAYKSRDGYIHCERRQNEWHFVSVGRARHTSEADKGHNAVLYLIKCLRDIWGDKIGRGLMAVSEKIDTQTDGQNMGIAVEDELSLPLICNVGQCHIDEGNGYFTLDIRYPVTIKGEDILSMVEEHLCDMKVTVEEHQKPLYVKEDSELIQKLKDVYETYTGEKGDPIAMTGGTYARAMGGNSVAFGASFGDGSEGNIHMPNEYITDTALWKNTDIMARAMAALMKR